MIEIKNLVKKFDGRNVIDNVSMTIREGEQVVIIGPSGSGKSTFIRCINCLEDADGGSIYFDGEDIADFSVDINVHRQNMGMVFQSFNLFNNKTVLENITLAPIHIHGKRMKKEGMSKKERTPAAMSSSMHFVRCSVLPAPEGPQINFSMVCLLSFVFSNFSK